MSDGCLQAINESTKELQKRKLSLEERLNEIRQRRLLASDANSVWQLQLSQSANESARSLQCLKLAQHEVDQTHSKLKTLRDMFNGKNEAVKSLQRQIEEEKLGQKQASSDREMGLELIYERFKNLKCYHDKNQLTSQMKVLDELIKRQKVQLLAETERRHFLETKFKELESNSENPKKYKKQEKNLLSEVEQQISLSVLQEAQMQVSCCLDDINCQIQALQQNMMSMETEMSSPLPQQLMPA